MVHADDAAAMEEDRNKTGDDTVKACAANGRTNSKTSDTKYVDTIVATVVCSGYSPRGWFGIRAQPVLSYPSVRSVAMIAIFYYFSRVDQTQITYEQSIELSKERWSGMTGTWNLSSFGSKIQIQTIAVLHPKPIAHSPLPGSLEYRFRFHTVTQPPSLAVHSPFAVLVRATLGCERFE